MTLGDTYTLSPTTVNSFHATFDRRRDNRGSAANLFSPTDLGVNMFVNQPNLLRHLFRFLGERRLKPVSLSTDRGKLDRQNALRDFNSGEARVLLTTDEAMTGIDIPDVPWVLHFELPTSALAYVHRAGRTGRAAHVTRSPISYRMNGWTSFARLVTRLRAIPPA